MKRHPHTPFSNNILKNTSIADSQFQKHCFRTDFFPLYEILKIHLTSR